MNEDVKKHLRTQGKYSNKGLQYEDKGSQKSRDKRQKVSPAVKEPHEKKFHKRSLENEEKYHQKSRYKRQKASSTVTELHEKNFHKGNSNGHKGANSSISDENDTPVKYQQHSDHSFSQLEEVKKPIEIKTRGKVVLSETDNGESVVLYEPPFINEDEADDLYERLYATTNWYEKNIVIQGVEYPQPRLVAWYGPFPYTYSGATLQPAEMPEAVLYIKKKVEEYLSSHGISVTLNSVLLNLYRNNKDSVAWHSDDELTMGVCPTIASVSLGDTRKFEMRRKLKRFEDESSYDKLDKYFAYLTHGSLLIMNGCMQKDWQHRVPKEYHNRRSRINLTFRTVYPLEKIPPVPPTEIKKPNENVSNKPHGSRISFDVVNFPPLNDSVSPSCSDIMRSSHEEDQNFKSPGRTDEDLEFWDTEPSYNKNITSSFLNNLNDDNKNLKTDMQNKNLHTYDNSFSSDDVMYAADVKEEDKSFSEVESHNVSMDSPVSNMQENAYVVKKEPTCSRNDRWMPNVEAKEFIPINTPVPYGASAYSSFRLDDLLNYNIDLMRDEHLFDYASELRNRILEKIHDFRYPERETLELLCELTDGNQTEKNQKLISTKMCQIVSRTLIKQRTSPNIRKSSGHPRQTSYGNNQNQYSERRHQGRGRNNHRY